MVFVAACLHITNKNDYLCNAFAETGCSAVG